MLNYTYGLKEICLDRNDDFIRSSYSGLRALPVQHDRGRLALGAVLTLAFLVVPAAVGA